MAVQWALLAFRMAIATCSWAGDMLHAQIYGRRAVELYISI